jgi:hypothetical protein
MDRLTKTAHFIPVHTTYDAKDYASLYIEHIVLQKQLTLFLKPSFPIGDLSLWRVFGNNYISQLAQKSYAVQLIVLRLMVKLKK